MKTRLANSKADSDCAEYIPFSREMGMIVLQLYWVDTIK